jgi:nucleotide-binding universal stress UspA family protein
VILVCYDGSPDAQTAVDRAGELLPGENATILTVWEPFASVMSRTGASLGYGSGAVDADEIDEASRQSAKARADEGVERAKSAGLDAHARTKPRADTVAETILSEADMLGAKAIVVGTRGLTGLRSLFLGSVSHAVLQHADRPVMVVPSRQVATARAADRAP